MGIIEKLGSGVRGFTEGQRVIAGAITPSGWSSACLCGVGSQDGAGTAHGWKAMGGWKLGNTIDGCQAEYVLVPDAMANLAAVPDTLEDEQVLMCPDIMSTGFSGAESAGVRIGDTYRTRRKPDLRTIPIDSAAAYCDRRVSRQRRRAQHGDNAWPAFPTST